MLALLSLCLLGQSGPQREITLSCPTKEEEAAYQEKHDRWVISDSGMGVVIPLHVKDTGAYLPTAAEFIFKASHIGFSYWAKNWNPFEYDTLKFKVWGYCDNLSIGVGYWSLKVMRGGFKWGRSWRKDNITLNYDTIEIALPIVEDFNFIDELTPPERAKGIGIFLFNYGGLAHVYISNVHFIKAKGR